MLVVSHIGTKHRCFYLTPCIDFTAGFSTIWCWRWAAGTKAMGEFLMIQFNLTQDNFRISIDFSTKPTSGYILVWRKPTSYFESTTNSIACNWLEQLEQLLFWLQKENEASQVLQWFDRSGRNPGDAEQTFTHPRVDRTSWKFNSSIPLIQIIA